MLEIGSIFEEKYQVIAEIGKGGTSHVYLVLNPRANKQWAVKEVAKDGGGETDVIGRKLIADVDILMSLDHEHIPKISDVIEKDDYYYIMMDYVEGVTLLDVVENEGAQPEDKVVKWSLQLCDVLRYLHSQKPKIIYRDTKPKNIMLKPNDDIMLIDFGAAREYKKHQAEDTYNLGTRGYAAPEQFGGQGQTDERTDIYNLGATMYHLLTGHNPSKPPYDMYPIRRWNPELSSGLEYIILKCTKANPEDRYQTVEELTYDLEHYVSLEEKNRRKTRLYKGLMILSLLTAGLLFTASFMVSRRAGEVTDNRYETIIRNAQTAPNKDKQMERYKEAITFDPSKVQAYDEILIRVFLADGIFTQEEADEMTEILGASYTGRRTNEENLRSSAGYAEFAYQMGLAYFYYYEGRGNKPMSEAWLTIAAKGSSAMTTTQYERARRLSKIAGYYSGLSIQNLAGDSTASYAEYWADMKALTNGNMVAMDNPKTAYVMYQDVTYQIAMHASDFRKAGVPRQELETKLSDIEARLRTDFTTDDIGNNEEIVEAIRMNLSTAYSSVNIAYRGAS